MNLSPFNFELETTNRSDIIIKASNRKGRQSKGCIIRYGGKLEKKINKTA